MPLLLLFPSLSHGYDTAGELLKDCQAYKQLRKAKRSADAPGSIPVKGVACASYVRGFAMALGIAEARHELKKGVICISRGFIVDDIIDVYVSFLKMAAEQHQAPAPTILYTVIKKLYPC